MKKQNLKKLFAGVCAAAMMLALAACGTKAADPTAAPTTDPAGSSAQPTQTGSMPKIGILQYATHASLYNCYTGIVQGLEEAGYIDGETCTIQYVDGQGVGENNDMAAASFVNDGYDIIIAIATPAAMSAYAAAKDAGIPVVFSAVSDPVSAGLAASLEAPGSGATGTCDGLNYKAQLELIRAFQPEAETIGILYTTSEANSKSQLANYEAIAADYGFTIVSQGVTDASEVAIGAAALVSDGVDCICNLTDNNVVNNFSVVTNATDAAGIPCYGSEEEQVLRYGCVASETLDYIALGRTTGQMAADVLNGADIATMPIALVTDTEPVYSSANMAKFDLTLPDAYADAREMVEA